MNSIVIKKKVISTGMRQDESWKVILKFDLRVYGKVIFLIFLTLARISFGNIYLNLFGGAHFH